MKVSTLGIAALSGALLVAGKAGAIEVHGYGFDSPSAPFERKGESKDGTKPWQVYSDPACDVIDMTKVTFSAGSHITGHHEQNDGYSFPRMEKYPSSHFHPSDSYPGWKNHQHDPYCTPVPEPQTYALLLAGLGVMTFVARRRQAQPSPTPA